MISDREPIHKILVVTLSNLGDVVLTLPVFQALIKKYPQAELHAVVGPLSVPVFEGDVRIAKIIPYDKRMDLGGKIEFLRKIRKERYDIIIDLRQSLLGLLGGARYHNSCFSSAGKKGHRALKHLKVLESILGPLELPNEAFLSAGAIPESETGQNVVVAAVGSKSDLKKWPAASYTALLDRLAIQENCRIILIGDTADVQDALKVERAMRSKPVNLTGQTRFHELVQVISRANLVITNDSAPLHIADALKIPSLVIFGPTDPRKYGPRYDKSLIVRKPLFCSPCEKAQCRYNNHACIREISVDEVFQKAQQILHDEHRPRNLKILIIRLDRIGDVVLSLPAVQAIRRRFPNAHIAMMVRPYAQSVVSGNPWIDEVIPYYYEKRGRHSSILGNLRFMREIVNRRFDVAFIFHPGHRSHLIPFFTGIPYRIGFQKGLDSFLLTKRIPDRCHEGLKHESEYILDIVRAFGVDTNFEKELVWPVFTEDELLAQDLFTAKGWSEGAPFIAIHPGASCASKRWPQESFSEVGARVLRETSLNIVLVGGNEDKEAAHTIETECGDRTRVLNLAGQLTLKQLAAVLKKASVLVSNDSGPAHVAAAVGTRTLCIFGRNEPGLSSRRWRTLGQGHQIIQKDVGCVTCLAHRCTIDFECLKAVSSDNVFQVLQKMLAAQPEPAAL